MNYAQLCQNHDLVIPLAGGAFICPDGDKHECGASVTIYDADGYELGHWDAKEWAEDPEGVMGAILKRAYSPYLPR